MTRRLIRNCSCRSATAKAWRFAQLAKGLSYLVHEGVTVGGVLIVRVGVDTSCVGGTLTTVPGCSRCRSRLVESRGLWQRRQ